MDMERFLDRFHDCSEEIQSAVSIEKKEHAELWEMVRSLRNSLDDIGLKDSCPLSAKASED